MENFDHVRSGNNGALVFSIEDGRKKTGKRAITILLNSQDGEYYGIKTSGYESVERLKIRPLLWERSAVITPSTDTATEPVTSRDAQQGGEQSGSASGQSGLSTGKDKTNSSNWQGKSEISFGQGGGIERSVTPKEEAALATQRTEPLAREVASEESKVRGEKLRERALQSRALRRTTRRM